jgi:hypothetical protein
MGADLIQPAVPQRRSVPVGARLITTDVTARSPGYGPGTIPGVRHAHQVAAVLDIHDHTVRALFSIGLSVQSVGARYVDDPDLRARVDDLIALLDASVRQVQRAAYHLGVTGECVTGDPPQLSAPNGHWPQSCQP